MMQSGAMQANPFRKFRLGPGGPGQMGGQPPQGGGGYTGLAGILSALQGGVNQTQLGHMAAGANGADGMGIGGMHGAFQGLSPQAMHYLATSGLLEKQAAQHQDVTGPDGQPLTGDALFKANFLNTLADNNAQSNPTYKLHSGVDQGFLQQVLGSALGGKSAYSKGYDANGVVGQNPGLPFRTAGGGGGGFGHPMGQLGQSAPDHGPYGYGKQGTPFNSRAAAAAAGRLGRGMPSHRLRGPARQQPR